MGQQSNQPQATVESLEATLEAKDKRIAELEKLVQEYGSQPAPADVNKILILEADLTKKDSQIAELEAFVEGQAETIAEQAKTIEKLQSNPSTVPTVTFDKKTYQVTVSTFKYKGTTYTRDELRGNKTLLKELIKKGVGFLVEEKPKVDD